MVTAFPLETILAKKKKSLWQRIKRPLGENHVFQIDDYYYKFPNYARLFHGKQDNYYDIAVKKHNLAQEYFWAITHIPETKIIAREDSYFIEQKAVAGEVFWLHHLKNNPELIWLLESLLKKNEEMRNTHGYALDICGTDILMDPLKLHNLICDGTKIYPIDTIWLLDQGGGNIIYQSLSQGIVPLQNTMAKALIKMSKL